MKWNKNCFSYGVWLIYTFITCLAVWTLSGTLNLPQWQTMGAAAIAIALYGVLAFILHKLIPEQSGKGNSIVGIVAEVVAVILIVSAGVYFRCLGFPATEENSVYYRMASLGASKQIPQILQGAVFFYLQILREIFFFFGNEITVAIWFQIVVQTAAFLVLYFAVRQMAGRVPALVMLGLCEFSGYMIESATHLSPDCLYLLFWAASLLWIASIREEKTDPIEFIPVGIFTALMGYINVMGFLLFFMAIISLFRVKEEKQEKGSIKKSVILCVISMVISLGLFLLLDSCLSKKNFASVVKAWFIQYGPKEFCLPMSFGGSVGIELYVMFALLLLGIYSFWYSKKYDRIKGWLFLALIIMAGDCFGIFTAEVPANTYIYLLFTILAGISLRECCRKESQVSVMASEAGGLITEQENPEARQENNKTEQENSETRPENSKTEEENPKAEQENVETKQENSLAEQNPENTNEKTIHFIENPLPLPKKHVKRVADFAIGASADDDYDYIVSDDDDFDID